MTSLKREEEMIIEANIKKERKERKFGGLSKIESFLSHVDVSNQEKIVSFFETRIS